MLACLAVDFWAATLADFFGALVATGFPAGGGAVLAVFLAPALAFEAADAYGVMGMRERARRFGGRIDIASAPGEGTHMCLTLALPNEARP